MTLTLAWVLVTLAAVMAYLIGYGRRPAAPAPKAPEAKVFGLKEARAAREFVTDPTHAKTVKAVVVGVLGYQDAVGKQVDGEVNGLEAAKTVNIVRQASYEGDILTLRANIADLISSNKGFDANIVYLNDLKDMFA